MENKKLDSAINELAKDPDVIELVNGIETGISTTKGNYGEYMRILTPYQDNTLMMGIFSTAMIRAGADVFGISSALQILKGGN